MNWKNLFATGTGMAGLGSKPVYRPAERGSLPRFGAAPDVRDTGLFAAKTDPVAGPVAKVTNIPGTPADRVPAAPIIAAIGAPRRETKARRSWFGWLFGGNRRRETGPLVQGELSLQNVRPLRNTLRDDDIALVERRQSKVIWETPAAGTTRKDQGHAWNRLRGRRLDKLVVDPD